MTFKAGVDWTGNRNGRPKKGLTLAALFEAEGARDHKKGLTNLEALIKNGYHRAVEGDEVWAKLVLDRQFGKALEMIEITDDRKPLDLSKLSDKELITLKKLLAKGENGVPDTDED
jgi:hypothetical protein